MTITAETMERLRGVGPAAVLQIAPPHADGDAADLVSHPAGPAPVGSHTLTDHGGSTIRDPRLVLVSLGQWWGDPVLLEAFAHDLMEAGYLAPLAAYGAGVGTFWGSVQGPSAPAHVKDSELQAILKGVIASGAVPLPDGHTLYALLLPEGVTVSFDDGSGSSCGQFCGYHSAIDERTFYSVQPSTSCQPCNGGLDAFAAFCMVLAHEVAEACTDAVPGSGWFEDKSGAENADLCAWIVASYGPWTVQPFYTNEQGATVGAYNPRSVPQPPPPPPSTGGLEQAIQIVTELLAKTPECDQCPRAGVKAALAALETAASAGRAAGILRDAGAEQVMILPGDGE